MAEGYKTDIGNQSQISSIWLAEMASAPGYKTEHGNQSQISSMWLAEMAAGRHFSQSDAWDLSQVSNLSFMILGPDMHISIFNIFTMANSAKQCKLAYLKKWYPTGQDIARSLLLHHTC
jgi:hypothetical protein